MNRICIAACALLLFTTRVSALQAYYDAVTSTYSISGTRLGTCTICHSGSDPNNNSSHVPRNSYGSSFASQPHAFNNPSQNQSALRAIEGSDSDGDGASNLTEINNLTFPGNASDKPDTTAPSVSITSPAGGSSYGSPQTVTIQVDATDNLSVNRVEFFQNGAFRGSDTGAPYAFDWTVNPDQNGSHTWVARAFDSAGNSAESSVSLTVSIDLTAPSVVIDTPGDGSVLGIGQTISIQASATDNVGVARVEFIRDGVPQASDDTAPYSIDWTPSGSDLGAHTWTARAFDAAGNSTETLVTLTVTDSISPTVAITSPANGSSVGIGQTVSIQASAGDNVGVARVDFFKDGAPQSSDTSEPYSVDWTPTGGEIGAHTWTARAFDGAGNSAESSISLTVGDTLSPSVNITSPGNGASVGIGQTVSIQASASDNVGVARVDFFKDGTLQTSDASEPYAIDWTPGGGEIGAHTWTARAFDAAGNSSESSISLSVIDSLSPSVNITSPANGSSVGIGQTVSIQASASDNVSVARVDFFKDGTLQTSDTSDPYSVDWTPTVGEIGTHTWTARAFDGTGNSAESSISLTAGDTLSPTVAITFPQNNSSIGTGQGLSIQASASDNVGVARVEFFRDGVLQATDTSEPFSIDWNPSGAEVGAHTWTARAFDAAGNSAESSITLTVTDTLSPTIAITAPSPNSSFGVGQVVSIVASAQDNVGVVRVEFFKDGTPQGTDTSAPYSFDWTPTGSEIGSSTWMARAFDAAGNSAENAISITVSDSISPTVSISSPQNNSSVAIGQAVSIQANAADNVAVVRVEFFKDGVAQNIDTTSPFSADWTPSGSEIGSHTWVARAFDAAGNSSETSVTLVVTDTISPSINISSPANNSTVGIGQTVSIQASADDNVGVVRVEFFKDGNSQSSDATAPFSVDWTPTPSELGPHTWVARAFDAVGNSADATITLTVTDTLPPSITITAPANNTSVGIGQLVAIQVSANDNVGVVRVEFFRGGASQGIDTTSPYSFAWTPGASDIGSHSWLVRAFDAAGNSSESTLTLTVADASTPSVSIASPSDNSTFAGGSTVSIQATASDDTGISRVEFYRDGTLQNADSAAPYSFDWITTSADVGTHLWVARAFDTAGNSADASVTLIITDQTPPAVSITAPANNSSYSSAQTVPIQAQATDNVGVAKVDFIRNGAVQATDSAAPFTFDWAVTVADNGTHQWIARAFDAAGNQQSSAPVTLTIAIVTVDSAPPTVTITAPASNSSFTSPQTVAIQAQATDNTGVSRVEFYLDGALQGTDTVAPFSFDWSVTAAINGSHQWTARAFDPAGNQQTSVPVVLTVNIPTVDATLPVVSISSPADQSIYATAQNIVLQANASDNVGVTRVEFYDNGILQASDTSAPFRFDWTFDASDNGTHTWTARAYDAAGNVGTSQPVTATVNVPGPPPPLQLAVNGRALTLTWASSDNGIILQQSTALGAAANWQSVPATFTSTETTRRVTVPMADGAAKIARQAGNLTIEWNGSARLQTAPSPRGPWTDVAEARSPYRIPASTGMAFYRLRAPVQVFYRLHRP